MWLRLELTGRPSAPGDFPAVAALYRAGLSVARSLPGNSRRSTFNYHGKRYGMRFTSLGRFGVVNARTGALIVQGGIGALW